MSEGEIYINTPRYTKRKILAGHCYDCKKNVRMQTKAEGAEYDTLVGLLRKRFPPNADGSLPDWDVAAILRQNEAQGAEIARLTKLKVALSDIAYSKYAHGYTMEEIAANAMDEYNVAKYNAECAKGEGGNG